MQPRATGRDYVGRPVCVACGHTAQLHKPDSVCGAAGCYCTGYVKEGKR